MKTILNAPLCVDDFGDEVFQCQYTSKLVRASESVFIGPCVPQLAGTYVCAPDAHAAFKESKRLFDENDANCNTCANLHRVKHERSKFGTLYGTCLLSVKRGVFWFHPDDAMLMDCWSARK